MFDTKYIHNPVHVKAIVFQIIYTLHTLQTLYAFSHNDLHLNNIFIVPDKNYSKDNHQSYYQYELPDGSVTTISVIPYKIQIYDFDRSRYCRVLDETHDYYNDPDSVSSSSSSLSNHTSINDFLFFYSCLLYTSPSPRDGLLSRMPSSA